jgi:glycosyltransferase involved in cell wall biosynthesis
MKALLISDKPIHYRVDLYNNLTKTFSDNISFFFIANHRNEVRNKISVFSGEPFHGRSRFFNGGSLFLRNVRSMIHIIQEKADIIVNVGMSFRLIFLILYSKLFRKKIILWWSGTKASEAGISSLKKCYRKLVSHLLDGAIVYSRLAEEYLLCLNKNLCNIMVIGNNSFDSWRYHRSVSRLKLARHKDRQNKVVVMTVGFLSPEKNIATLLKIYGQLKQKIDNIHLVIIGEGPELANLKRYCEENNIEDVTFKGFVPHTHMPHQYATADIYVHPSLLDRWPQTYNEAASAGLPILVSNASGVWNPYTEEFGNMVIFNPKDEGGLKRLLENTVKEESHRRMLGDKALKVALENDCSAVTRKISSYLNQFHNVPV